MNVMHAPQVIIEWLGRCVYVSVQGQHRNPMVKPPATPARAVPPLPNRVKQHACSVQQVHARYAYHILKYLGFFCPNPKAKPQVCPEGKFCPSGSSQPQTCGKMYEADSKVWAVNIGVE